MGPRWVLPSPFDSVVAGFDADNGFVGIIIERIVDRKGDASLESLDRGVVDNVVTERLDADPVADGRTRNSVLHQKLRLQPGVWVRVVGGVSRARPRLDGHALDLNGVSAVRDDILCRRNGGMN